MKVINDYIIGPTLGEGTHGKVKLGIHACTNQKFALKFIKTEPNTRNSREIEIMKLLDHRHIVKLHEVIQLQNPEQTILVMEYVSGGELFDHILSKGYLSEDESREFLCQILSALKYCHEHLVIHRDLKPENLLLDEDRNIKITDFGASNIMKPGVRLSSKCGSPLYTSPEVLLDGTYIGPEVDIWSLGVILYAMVTGCVPWEGEEISQQIRNASEGNFVVPSVLTNDCIHLITRMLNPDPQKRATLAEIFLHPWVNHGRKVPLSASLTIRTPLKREEIDTEILSSMVRLGFKSNEVIEALECNKMTENCVGLYYLLKKNKESENKVRSNSNDSKDSETKLDSPSTSPSSSWKFLGALKLKKRGSQDFDISNENQDIECLPRRVRIQLENTHFIQSPVTEIMEQIERKLSRLGVAFKKSTKKGIIYSCKGDNQKVKFELEICQPEITPGVKVIVHRRKKGDLQRYKILINQLCLQILRENNHLA